MRIPDHREPLTIVDWRVAQWFHAHSAPLLTQAMLTVTHLHNPIPVTVAVVLMAIYLAWKKNWYWLVCLGSTVSFGMLLNVFMKYAFHPARPSFDDPLIVLTTYSFPSSHVAGATLLYGVVAAMLVARINAGRAEDVPS